MGVLDMICMRKTISIMEESYWKLMELKVRLRAETWDSLIDKLYEVITSEQD